MRILFVGAIEFSRHCLQELLNLEAEVVAVVTPAPEQAKLNSDYADLQPVAAAHGIPVHRIRKVGNPEGIARIRSLQPDVIFVFGFSQLIPREILDIPPLGCIGTHPALLPHNRGRHPLIWALVEGLKESGLTFFYLDEGADSGDILWQKPFPITPEDDAGTLYEKIKLLATEAIGEFLPQLQAGTAPRVAQDHSRATYWRKRTEADGEIDWSAPTLQIYNLTRALTHPYVGAHTFCEGKRVIVWRSCPGLEDISKTCAPEGRPGQIVARTEDGLLARTGNGTLNLTDWESVGGQTLDVGMKLGRLQA